MNQYMQQHGDLYRSTQALRGQLLSALTDADLAYTPGGMNPTLGALCREMGDVEASYIDSLKTHQQDWMNLPTHPDSAALEGSVDRLRAWYDDLDRQLDDAINALSDDDLQNITVARTGDWNPPLSVQIHVYREALLVFYAKASVYLKGLNKSIPGQWQWWMG